jgi:SWI/SNF related-matrix-associated actin-dependent regulator of chromatin subfamily C
MLSSTVPAKHAAKLKAIVKAHRGVLVASPHEATHVVVKDAPRDPAEDPALDYLRTIEVKGKQALVHWWYYPDSYDAWLPAAEVEGEASPQEEDHDGPWVVVRVHGCPTTSKLQLHTRVKQTHVTHTHTHTTQRVRAVL